MAELPSRSRSGGPRAARKGPRAGAPHSVLIPLPARPAAIPLSNTVALLLAAGESTRMGELKALLPWEGRTLLEYQAAQLLQSPVREIVVVLGHRARELRSFLARRQPRLRAIYNRRYRQGKSTSIVAGLEALTPGWEAVLIIGVDQPRPAWVLERLVRAHESSSRLITLPAQGGRRGHPPVFSARLAPELLAITEERQGLREVVQRHDADIHAVRFRTPLVLVNLNTRADYERARELAAKAGR